MNTPPPYIFNSTHRGLSGHKCKKKFYQHKILTDFQVELLHCYGWGSRNHVQSN